MKMLCIIHDNKTGDHTNCGCTEYPLSDVWAEGGVNAILYKYRSNGVYVERWYIAEFPNLRRVIYE